MRVQKILQASAAVGLAESGYNRVAPLGYSTGDWYGSPALSRDGVRGQRSAPADFSMNNNRQEILQKMKDVNRPVMIVKGDMDGAVPVTNTRMWVDTMKEMKLNFAHVGAAVVRDRDGTEADLPVFAKNTRK